MPYYLSIVSVDVSFTCPIGNIVRTSMYSYGIRAGKAVACLHPNLVWGASFSSIIWLIRLQGCIEGEKGLSSYTARNLIIPVLINYMNSC